MKQIIFGAIIFLATLSTSSASTIFGIESTAGAAGGGFGSNPLSGSTTPARLFSFDLVNTTPSSLNIGPTITLDGTAIDADGLSMSHGGLLYAFQIDGSTSRMITIDSTTGAAAVVGTSGFMARSLRGATYMADGSILAVDSLNNELVRLSSLTGAVLGTTKLKAGLNDYDITNAVDIAMDAQGQIFIVQGDGLGNIEGGSLVGSGSPGYQGTKIFQVSLGTGALTLIESDTRSGDRVAVGATFTKDSPALTTFEMHSSDGLYAYTGPTFGSVTQLFEQVDGLLDSGRGDLASLPTAVPEPSTMVLLGAGAALLYAGRRRLA